MNYKKEKNYWLQDLSKRSYLQGVLSGVCLLLLISYLFYGTFFAAIGLSPYMIFHMKSWKKKQIQKKKQEFEMQFKEAIQSISVALNVGYSAENAMKEALVDLQLIYPKEARIRKEFCYMIRQMEMNLTLEQILGELGERTEDEEVKLFATIFGMAKRSGGDMIEIIRSSVWQISEKIEVKREVETLMAAKKMEFHVMSLIPFAMIGYIRLAFPEFMRVLYGNVLGVLIMSSCLGIYGLAYVWGRRIVEVEV